MGRIQLSVINKLYDNEEIVYDEEIKNYLRQILDLDEISQENVIAIHEEARLELV